MYHSQDKSNKTIKKLSVLLTSDQDFCNYSHSSIEAIGGHLAYHLTEASEELKEQCLKESEEIGDPKYQYPIFFDRLIHSRAKDIKGVITLKLPDSDCTLVPSNCSNIKEGDFFKKLSFVDSAIVTFSAMNKALHEELAEQNDYKDLFCNMFTFGIKEVIIAVDNMDMVDYDEEQFESIKRTISNILPKIGYRLNKVNFIPISSTTEDNICENSSNMQWYQGPLLCTAVNQLAQARTLYHPFKFLCSEAYREEKKTTLFEGKVIEGSITAGSNIYGIKLPKTKVLEIFKFGESISEAKAGDFVTLNVGKKSLKEIKSEHILTDVPVPPPSSFDAHCIFIKIINGTAEDLDNKDYITVGYQCRLSIGGTQTCCVVSEIISKLDKRTGRVLEENPEKIYSGDAAIFKITPCKPIICYSFIESAKLGRLLVGNQESLAVGIVKSIE
ncbi:unnamed protein product [Moneuplotes crassus]|uniref:GTP-eEF1A C-terminal domain-containing protein n=1 Tax=Euplotes crassus TaxID=5936 RepID=A0AAD1UMI0_EUPCR|nr:unnamed protein product [Moneuplotes crassus]